MTPTRVACERRSRPVLPTGETGSRVGLVREAQRGAYGPFDMIGHQALLAPSLVQSVVEFGNALAQIALDLHEAAGFLHPGFGLPRVEIAAAPLEKVWQLRRDDRVHATHVGTHRIQFAERTQDIVSVATLGIDRVPYDDLTGALPMAVDTAVPLFHHVRVVGDFEVDHQVAVVLEIDALRRGIGRQQDSHRGFRGVGLESGLHGLAILRIHAAIDIRASRSAPKPWAARISCSHC